MRFFAVNDATFFIVFSNWFLLELRTCRERECSIGFFARSAKHRIDRQCTEGVLPGSYRAETLAHGTASAADDINPLARETFSFAKTHFQAGRLCPKRRAFADGKESRVCKLIH
ncbi:hypothetical protein [Burkholderia sp. AU6039]|uniref:hypothetical protein n=1 Tax=Burkholderia sp. AU6039 TaxID=2015344 RepID=UPI00117E7AE8|nr:hypothetical protein [Burkholderia sp. AU6039]